MMRWVVGLTVCLFCRAALCATVYANPGDTLRPIIAGLSPGDTLILNPGLYSQTDGVKVINVNGTATLPITIEGATGGVAIIEAAYNVNAFEFTTSSYIILKNIEIRKGSNTVKFTNTGACHHITLQGLKLHDTYGVSVSGPTGGHHHITISDCEVYDTGKNASLTGEGIYMSYWDNPVDYLTIERCWIHTLNGTQKDGLELKYVRNAIIRDNVILGTNKTFPCIKIESADDATRTNLVERNICYDGDSGIETYGDCIVRNNIVFNCDLGIYSRDDAKYPLRNVKIINNTVYNCDTACLQLNGWSNKTGLVVANNVIYQPTASKQTLYIGPSAPLTSVTVTSNYYFGTLYLNTAPSTGFILAGTPDADFVDVDNRNFFPSGLSAFIDAGSATYAPADDFIGSGRPQGVADDVGALEWTEANADGFAIPLAGGFASNIITGVAPVDPPDDPPAPNSKPKPSGGCAATYRSDQSFAGMIIATALALIQRRNRRQR